MVNDKEMNPMVENLLSIYANMYGMSVEDLLAELQKLPGETLTDKLREYVNTRKGISAYGYLERVYNEKEYAGDQGTRWRIAVAVTLPDGEKKKLADALGLDQSYFEHPVFTVWTGDRRVVDSIKNIPVGSKVLITGIRTSTSETGTVFLNARSIIDRGIDPDFLDSISVKPEELKNAVFEEGRNVFIKLTGNVLVDPVETSTSKGDPKVRVYLSESTMVDFTSSAFTKLKNLLGDPYDNEKWNEFLKNKKVWIRAIYQRHVGGLPYFTVVRKTDVLTS